jgi:hypothetical protein
MWHPHQERAYSERIEVRKNNDEWQGAQSILAGAECRVIAKVPEKLRGRELALRIMTADEYSGMLESGGDDMRSHLAWVPARVEGSTIVSSFAVPEDWSGKRIRLCLVDAEALSSPARRVGVGGWHDWQVLS